MALGTVSSMMPPLRPSARWAIAKVLRMPDPPHRVQLQSVDTVEVDDSMLRGTLLLPKGAQWPLPAVLVRTPYGRRQEFGQMYLAERGFAVLVQDTRGRFSSDGDFVPVQDERADGHSTVAWMKQQPWCNGHIGVTGASYLGFTAWAAAAAGVDVVVPVITQSRVHSALFRPGGAISLELVVLWLYLVLHLMSDMEHDPASALRKMAAGLWRQPVQRSLMHLPVAEIDEILLGRRQEFFQEGIRNISPDSDFWREKDVLYNFEGQVPPCHMLSGWYDFFLEECLEDFRRARAKQADVRLTVGGFGHWGVMKEPRLYHQVLLDIMSERLMSKQQQVGAGHSHWPVNIYVLGARQWRGLSAWPPATAELRLWLSPASLSRGEPGPRESWEESFVYDPADPTPAAGGPSFNILNCGPKAQARIEQRNDVLMFTSDVLLADVTVMGRVLLQLRCTHSAESTDFVGRLCDVNQEGASVNRCEGLARVVARAGQAKRVTVDLGNIAACFRRGHRIRLHVCSGAHPRWMRNLGTGEHPATATEMVVSRNMVFSGSHISLPIEIGRSAL